MSRYDTTGLPVLENVSGLGRHTVDTPVCLPVLVTDGDAEPAIVGSDDLYALLLLALYEQLLALAGVAGPDGCLKLPCNNKSSEWSVWCLQLSPLPP